MKSSFQIIYFIPIIFHKDEKRKHHINVCSTNLTTGFFSDEIRVSINNQYHNKRDIVDLPDFLCILSTHYKLQSLLRTQLSHRLHQHVGCHILVSVLKEDALTSRRGRNGGTVINDVMGLWALFSYLNM